MGKVKKLIITLIVLALVAGAGVGGLWVIKKNNIKYVQVAPVSDLIEEVYWGDDGITFDGSVASNVSQTITLPAESSGDVFVDKIYVSEGDDVKKGYMIVSYDTTLAEMKLNILRMRLMQYQLQYNEAANRLADLRAGAPLDENIDLGGSYSTDSIRDDMIDDSGEADDDDEALLPMLKRGYLALARPFLLAFETLTGGEATESYDLTLEDDEDDEDDGEIIDDEEEDEDGFTEPEGLFFSEDEDDEFFFDETDGIANYNRGDTQDDIIDDAADPEDGDAGVSRTEAPMGKISDLTSDDVDLTELFNSGSDGTLGNHVPWLQGGVALDGNAPWGIEGSFFSEEAYLRVIDWDSVPFMGLGTEQDPFVYLCTCAKGKVTVTGAFLNVMAGYNSQGTILENPEGYWYKLEWHKYDTITDLTDRKASCTGFYLIDGKTLIHSVDPGARTDFLLDDADIYEEEIEEPIVDDTDDLDDDDLDDLDLDDIDDDDDAIRLDRNEIIRYWDKRVRSLDLTVRKQEIAVEKQEKVANKKAIYARMDGVVARVATNSAGARQIQIKSNEGYVVLASLSELYLTEVTPGTLLSCQDYSAGGTFTAKVTDVSVYPTTGNSFYFYGNPNTSFYTLTASIEDDKGVKYSDNDFLSISLVEPASGNDEVVINRAFVRSENGAHFVYKDVGGVIKKHYVKVSGFINGGYSVQVESGLKTSDLIAFPYGSDLAEGLPTIKVRGDTIMGY